MPLGALIPTVSRPPNKRIIFRGGAGQCIGVAQIFCYMVLHLVPGPSPNCKLGMNFTGRCPVHPPPDGAFIIYASLGARYGTKAL